MKFFEDIEIGEEIAYGDHTFATDEIVAFARRWDPQAFHVDPAAAEASHFGGLCASGWHTACAWMRLYVAHVEKARAGFAGRPGPHPEYGPSPGFEDLQWRRPVYAGDTLSFSARVTDTRPLASRPGWGLVTSRNEGFNQNGDLAFAFTSKVFVKLREG